MKKIIILFTCVIVVLSAIYLSLLYITEDPVTDDTATDPWGLTLTATDVTPTGLTLLFTQEGGAPTGTLTTGQPYSIECYQDGQWETLNSPVTNWTTEGWGISMNQTVSFQVNWASHYGSLDPGLYRISKRVLATRSPGASPVMQINVSSSPCSVSLINKVPESPCMVTPSMVAPSASIFKVYSSARA